MCWSHYHLRVFMAPETETNPGQFHHLESPLSYCPRGFFAQIWLNLVTATSESIMGKVFAGLPNLRQEMCFELDDFP